MITSKLITFIKQEELKGHTKDEIRSALSAKGWSAASIEEGLQLVPRLEAPVSPTVHGKLPGTFDLICTSFLKYKTKWKTYTGIVGVFIAIALMLIALVGVFYTTNLPLIVAAAYAGNYVTLFVYLAMLIVPVCIVMPLLQLLTTTTLYLASKNSGSVEHMFSIALAQFRGVIIVKICALAILFTPIFFVLLISMTIHSPLLAAILIPVAILMMVILCVFVTFALPACLIGNAHGMQAIRKSIKLVDGRFFPVLGRGILFGVIIMLFSTLLGGILPIIGSLVAVFVLLPLQVLFTVELYTALVETLRKQTLTGK